MNGPNRYKANQLIKVEKENENLELKKRMKIGCKDIAAERSASTRKETVWDRLSKVRKTPSTENIALTRSRQNLNTKPSHRFHMMRQMAEHHKQQQQQDQQQQQLHQQPQPQQQPDSANQSPRRPLTPNPNPLSNRSRKYHMQKAIIVPEVDNQGFVYVCKPVKSVREILTARSLNPSQSSIDDFKSKLNSKGGGGGSAGGIVATKSQSTSLTLISTDNIDSSDEDDEEEFKLAPLMPSRSQYDLLKNSSAKIVSNFHEVLKRRGKAYLEPDELEMVKNVIKADKRYHNLDRQNPALFKEILRSQLQDILKHEYAVKQALERLESSEGLPGCHTSQALHAVNEIVAYGQRSAAEPQKLEVDVVFKNVPSLEKEIVILRALGEKLDATLKRTNSQRASKSNETSTSSQSRDTTNTLHTLTSHRNTLITHQNIVVRVKAKALYIVDAIESNAISIIAATGIRVVTGEAHEFRIAQKTIVELKEDANHPFYIPVADSETAELKQTSFRKLKQNPDILLRHLKPKNDTLSFNLLDHDPVFFNNIFFNKSQRNIISPSVASLSGRGKGGEYRTHLTELKLDKQTPVLCEGGDSRQFNEVLLKREKFQNKDSSSKQRSMVAAKNNNKNNTTPIEPSARGGAAKDRKRIRRSTTPLPMKECISPKNSLFKTILVGSVHLSCFMLLIVAFTYPEAKC